MVSEEKIFENVKDGERTDAGPWPSYKLTSGELKIGIPLQIPVFLYKRFHGHVFLMIDSEIVGLCCYLKLWVDGHTLEHGSRDVSLSLRGQCCKTL